MNAKPEFFVLIGRPTMLFRVVDRFTVMGDCPCVRGITADGKWSTIARVADVNFVAATDRQSA